MSTLQAKLSELSAPRVNMKALNYQNDRVHRRLMDEFGMGEDEAKTLFEDTLKFLALTDGNPKLSPPARIDLGWHNFILHTRDYADFCQNCFGKFIHHEPGSGLSGVGPRLDVLSTAELARAAFGKLSSNWNNIRGDTCGSNGC